MKNKGESESTSVTGHWWFKGGNSHRRSAASATDSLPTTLSFTDKGRFEHITSHGTPFCFFGGYNSLYLATRNPFPFPFPSSIVFTSVHLLYSLSAAPVSWTWSSLNGAIWIEHSLTLFSRKREQHHQGRRECRHHLALSSYRESWSFPSIVTALKIRLHLFFGSVPFCWGKMVLLMTVLERTSFTTHAAVDFEDFRCGIIFTLAVLDVGWFGTDSRN